jgi:hypothetical protein
VRDRLSFRRFCGLPLEAETPPHASIWRFRRTIDKLGLSAALLSETNRQLDALGPIIRSKPGRAVRFLVFEHPLRRRARSRHDEALVWHEPRPLSLTRPQRLPSPVRCRRQEHETGACAHGARMKPPSREPAEPAARAAKPQRKPDPERRDDARQPSARPPAKIHNSPVRPQKTSILKNSLFTYFPISRRSQRFDRFTERARVSTKYLWVRNG